MSQIARRFAQVDVFTPEPGLGNPVAVVIDAGGLDDAALQRFATWTNLAETTFLLPPTEPTADYRVRIFTTSRELPFAGHPTLGSAHAWLEANGEAGRERVIQECGVGLVEVRRTGGRLAFAGPPLMRTGPLDADTLAVVTTKLGIDRDEIIDHAWTDNGPGWASVLLSDAQRVLSLRPGPDKRQDVGVVGLHPDGTPEIRAFVTDGGGFEDPVTGSLNAGIAEWLLGTGRLTAPYVAHQGTALGRRGRVHIQQDGGRIWIGGDTHSILRGTAAL